METTIKRDEQQEMQAGADRLAQALNDLVALTGYGADLDDPEERARALQVLADHGQELEDTRDEDGDYELDEDSFREAAIEALDEFGLDFYETGERRPGGEWDATGWVMVIGTGGPHYELRDDGYVHGWGWFGANKVMSSVDSSVCDYYAGLTDI